MGTYFSGFMRFNKGMLKLPLWVQAFMMWLMAVNLFAPLYFWDFSESKVIFVVMVVNATAMMGLTGHYGFTRILGLGHLLWVPLTLYIGFHVGRYPATEPFGLFLRVVMATNLIALAFDINDVIRYLRGERAEIVSTL